MKKFIIQLFVFVLVAVVIMVIGLLLPPTPRAKTTLLFSKVAKDALLSNSPSPRIIFVGGSNLSFGLNSQAVKDQLGLNPINTGIHASLGLEYMIQDVEGKVKKGDIVVVSAEYDQFYDTFAYGDEELLRLILDVKPKQLWDLSPAQWKVVAPFLPKYAISKFNPVEYLYTKEDPIYSVNAFNRYGDDVGYYGMPAQKFMPYPEIKGELNLDILKRLASFRDAIKAKGAKLFITFPAYQASSYDLSAKEIQEVKKVLSDSDFELISKPEDYRFQDDLFFNTHYHLLKKGVDLRTEMLIRDLKAAIEQDAPEHKANINN